MKKMLIILFICMGALFYYLFKETVKIVVDTQYKPDSSLPADIEKMRQDKVVGQDLIEVYKELPLIDIHSHDVTLVDVNEKRITDYGPYTKVWERYGIDKTVLFGAVSEPAAVKTDELTWSYYKRYIDYIYPSFAGIPLDKQQAGLTIAKEKLEQGYLNIGEIFAASTYSRNGSVLWKAEHPNSGRLPEIYKLAGEYNVPVLLHIDPPKGTTINFLKTAMEQNPETKFIFGHGNVYNSPSNLSALLKKHDNLYIDFFAGFTKYNQSSEYDLQDFVPLIEEYPDHFLLGSDSGYDIGLENSYRAMYELIDLLSPTAVAKVASQNYEGMIEEQSPTDYQLEKIIELADKLQLRDKEYRLNKRKANELIFELEAQTSLTTSPKK